MTPRRAEVPEIAHVVELIRHGHTNQISRLTMKQRMQRKNASSRTLQVARAPQRPLQGTAASQPGRRRQRQPRVSRALTLRRRHQLRPYPLVELRRGENTEFNTSLLQRRSLLVRLFRNLRSFVVPDVGIERGDQHER